MWAWGCCPDGPQPLVKLSQRGYDRSGKGQPWFTCTTPGVQVNHGSEEGSLTEWTTLAAWKSKSLAACLSNREKELMFSSWEMMFSSPRLQTGWLSMWPVQGPAVGPQRSGRPACSCSWPNRRRRPISTRWLADKIWAIVLWLKKIIESNFLLRWCHSCASSLRLSNKPKVHQRHLQGCTVYVSNVPETSEINKCE